MTKIEAGLPHPATASAWALLPALPAALLLYLSFFPIGCGWLGWIALVPLLGLVRSPARPRRIYWSAFAVGVAFYAPTLQWFRVADDRMYATWIFLTLYCALYFPVTIGLVRYLERRTRVPLIVTLPVIWTALELFRSTFGTGFSWYLLGHTQHDFLEAIQIADITGAYGVTFLVVMVNALAFEVLFSRHWFRAVWGVGDQPPRWSRLALLVQALVVLPLGGLVLLYGVYRLDSASFTPGPRVALMQSNLRQSVRNDVGAADLAAHHGFYLCDLAAYYHPDLIVWPETTCPEYWEDTDPELSDKETPAEWQTKRAEARAAARRMGQRWKTAVLLGLNAKIYEADQKPRQYNTALLLDSQGQPVGRYDKIHRVPFGEYVPFQEMLPFMRLLSPYDFDYGVAPGRRYARLPLTTPQGRTYSFGVAICYEDTDPDISRHYGAGRAATDFLVNISNDGWFNGTAEHEQHLAICRFRAVECRCAVVRSVNMGISAVIDGNGRVLSPQSAAPPYAGSKQFDAMVAKLFDGIPPRVWSVAADAEALPVRQWGTFKKTPGVLLATLPLDHRNSFYALAGDWLPWACWLVLAALLGVAWGRGDGDGHRPERPQREHPALETL